jgi:hypothetical protein
MRGRRPAAGLEVISNPLWIALTVPGRWVSDQYGSSTASH